jgi:hypothetical protein
MNRRDLRATQVYSHITNSIAELMANVNTVAKEGTDIIADILDRDVVYKKLTDFMFENKLKLFTLYDLPVSSGFELGNRFGLGQLDVDDNDPLPLHYTIRCRDGRTLYLQRQRVVIVFSATPGVGIRYMTCP